MWVARDIEILNKNNLLKRNYVNNTEYTLF